MHTTTPFRLFSPLFVTVTALLLSACGGGGGGGNGGGGDGPTFTLPDDSSPETYMAFYGATNLWMIDPDDPLNRLVVDNSIQSPFSSNDEAPPAPVLGGDWNSTDQVVENPRVGHVVYANDTGNLFRVATDLGGDPTTTEGPEQMSGANENPVCGMEVAPAFGNPLQGIAAFLAEDSGNCDPSTGDGVWRVTRIGAGSSTGPTDLGGEPVKGVLDDNGNPLGYLIYDDAASELKRVDLSSSGNNLSPNETLDGTVNSEVWAGGALPGGPGPLFVDGELHIYERQAGGNDRFEGPLYTLADSAQVPREHAHAADTFYFIDNNFADGALHEVDLVNGTIDKEKATATIENTSIGTQLYRVVVMPDHVAWFYPTASDNTHLVVYDRSDFTTPVIDVDIGNAQSTVNPPILRRTGGWLFYSHITADGSPEAVARKADGSDTVTFDNARWLGGSHDPFTPDLTQSYEQVQLLQGMSSSFDYPGASLKTVAGNAPGAGTVDHGTLPSDATGAQLMPLGMGSTRLLQVSTGSQDVYFFDSTASGSLTQVDQDDGTNRLPVLFF